MNNIPDNRFGFDCLLFERCNLNCKFCLEDHANAKVDCDYILNIPKDVVHRFSEELKHLPRIEVVSIRLWGGELFMDSLSDEMFDVYKRLVDEFVRLFQELDCGIRLEITWLSNGVFRKWDRVEDVLRHSHGRIGFSYDPVDRFRTQDEEQSMLDTANHFNQLGLCESISITLTKPSIECYLNTDKIFNIVGFPLIDINHYVANPRWEQLIPSDEDIYSFFKFLIDHRIFNVLDIQNMMRSIINNTKYPVCNCHRHISHCKGMTTYNCVLSSSVLGNEMFYASPKDITEQNVSETKMKEGVAKRGCLLCDYCNICIQPCWTSILFKGSQLDQTCPYHRLYDYVLQNKDVLRKFKEDYQDA